MDKFYYLASALQNEAKNKLSAKALETAYEKSWNNLDRAYGSKRILISHHLNKLLNLPQIDNCNYKSLTDLTDKALKHIEALKSLKMKLPSEAIVVILENKLDSYRLELWDKEVSNHELPKLEVLTDFLYHLAARLSCQDREKPFVSSESWRPQSAKILKIDNKNKKSYALVTQNKNQPNCTLCPTMQHPLYLCKNFNSMSLEKRLTFAKKTTFVL